MMSTYHRQMFHSLPMRMPAAASGPGADPMRTRMPPVEAGDAGGAKVVGCFLGMCEKNPKHVIDLNVDDVILIFWQIIKLR